MLEFDHVRGEKIRALADMAWRGFGIERIEAEIAKCEVRCANCHRRKTAREQAWHAAVLVAPTG